MNNLQITKKRVKAWNACTEGYRWFLEKFPQGGQFAEVYRALQDDKRYDDSRWLADRVFAELDTPTRVQQTVKIAGADRALIQKAAQDAGYRANAATTGNWANAATTGNWANAATTGYGANAATTGDGANAATTGDWANAATTGCGANAATTGKNSIAASLGRNGKAKAGENGCLIVGYMDSNNRPRVCVGYVGENGIKADTWYSVVDGRLTEVEE